MKNNKEFFKFIENLVNELKILGESNAAESIEKAERISSVPGEVFGALRLELKRLHEKEVSSRLKCSNEINIAIDILDRILDG